jgi:hypothetical protein
MPILITAKNVAINKKITHKLFLKKEENTVFFNFYCCLAKLWLFWGILWQLVHQFQNQHKIQLF